MMVEVIVKLMLSSLDKSSQRAMAMLRTIKRGPAVEKDRGYAWVILIIACLSDSIHLFAMLSNLTVAHKDLFSISVQESGSIGSVHVGLLLLFGPIASILVKTVGCRLTEIIGGLCVVAALALSSLTTDPWHAYLLYGVLSAFGMISAYTATATILPHYFEKYRHLAFAIVALGFYVGMSTLPLLLQYLLDTYGYGRSMGIFSSLHCVHLIAGLMYYEPKCENSSIVSPESSDASTTLSTMEDGSINELNMNEEEPVKLSSDGESEQQYDKAEINQTVGGEGYLCVAVPNTDVGLFASGGIISVAHIAKTEKKDQSSLAANVLQLLKQKKIWVLLLSALFWNGAASAFLILINDYIIVNVGLTSQQATFGITVIGIGNMAGCVPVMIGSRLTFNRLYLNILCIIIYSGATIAMSFSNSMMMYYALAALWGLGQGAQTANLLSTICEFCHVDQLALLIGLHLTAGGVGNMAGAPLSSLIADTTEAYYGLIFSGVCGLFGALVMLPVAIYMRNMNRTSSIEDQ